VQKYKELYEVTKNGLQSQTELVAGVFARACDNPTPAHALVRVFLFPAHSASQGARLS
jgi:hypothetical protein